MAFVDMHIFSRDFLHFDMSLLLLTFTLRGVSNKHCLLSLFSFTLIGQAVSSEMFENGERRQLRTPEHGYTIRSPVSLRLR